MWARIVFPSWSGKRNPQVVHGAASASAPKGEPGQQQHRSSREDLEKKVSPGSNQTSWIPGGPWSLWTTVQSTREFTMTELGEEEGSNHCPLDWMMYGKVPREKLSQGSIREEWGCNPGPRQEPLHVQRKGFMSKDNVLPWVKIKPFLIFCCKRQMT